MPKTARQEAAEMLTELLFRFYSAGQRHPRVTQGRRSTPMRSMCCICLLVRMTSGCL